jgi:hypothetical protein
MSPIDDGGPAFPHKYKYGDGTAGCADGMSLRDYNAIHAPQPDAQTIEFESRCDRNLNPHNEPHKPAIRSQLEIICDLRYKYADAMLKARSKK